MASIPEAKNQREIPQLLKLINQGMGEILHTKLDSFYIFPLSEL